jgi:hypothetical protein
VARSAAQHPAAHTTADDRGWIGDADSVRQHRQRGDADHGVDAADEAGRDLTVD